MIYFLTTIMSSKILYVIKFKNASVVLNLSPLGVGHKINSRDHMILKNFVDFHNEHKRKSSKSACGNKKIMSAEENIIVLNSFKIHFFLNKDISNSVTI